MADVETSLYSVLSSFSALTDLVGGSGATCRIFPLHLPQDRNASTSNLHLLPAVTYQRISTITESAFSADSDLVQYRYQVNALGRTNNEAYAVAAQVLAVLQRHSAGAIQDIFLEDMFTDYDETTDTYRYVIDLKPWWSPDSNRAPTYDGGLSGYTVNRGGGGVGTFTINSVDSHYADPDGDTLTYTVAGSDDTVATVKYDPGRVVLTHTTTGSVTVTLTATDPVGLSVAGSFVVTFTGVS